MSTRSYTLPFTVASALLRELGERLVGQPHIALAELIKNAYDADASKVEIRVDPEASQIEIIDNGHGMTAEEFKRFWMHIGSPHKASQRISRNLKRPVTGSKGVGRLSVQFLARTIELTTVSENDVNVELHAFVDWDRAIEAEDLTNAEAQIEEKPRQAVFPENKRHGARILLQDLNQEWNTDNFKSLARQVWWLRPPFAEQLPQDDPQRFDIDFSSTTQELEEAFHAVLNTVLHLWHARIRGRLIHEQGEPLIQLLMEFNGGKRYEQQYSLGSDLLHDLQFDIRVFHLKYRQPHGISVKDARDYFKDFGGVGIYDAGFRLPYYGPDADWLDIEFDHAHRLNRSQLVPEELQVRKGLQFLPTNSRLFGVVSVNTSKERELIQANPEEFRKNRYLQIQISRDRLVDNEAFNALRYAVRWALDYYAMREKERTVETTPPKPDEPTSKKLKSVEEVLEDYRSAIPAQAYREISVGIREAVKASETEAERTLKHMELLGSLATAGMVALASEHEINQQYRILERLIGKLRQAGSRHGEIEPLVLEIEEWLHRAQSSRALFAPLLDTESREERKRYRVKPLIEDIVRRIAPLSRETPIDTQHIDPQLRLPTATFAGWNAVFQNALLNAVNALIDSDERRIEISSGKLRNRNYIKIQDTGCGIDLNEAELLFQAFERRLELSLERKRLAIGGSGLGLTIVRLIAEQAGCQVSFVEPDEGFTTAFELAWKEE